MNIERAKLNHPHILCKPIYLSFESIHIPNRWQKREKKYYLLRNREMLFSARKKENLNEVIINEKNLKLSLLMTDRSRSLKKNLVGGKNL